MLPCRQQKKECEIMFSITQEYPLEEIQYGAPFGNGLLGGLLGGGGRVLNLTLGCANLWDHRGGMVWREGQSFRRIREYLEKKDMDSLKAMFKSKVEGNVHRPCLIPLGRIEITLPENCELLRNVVELESGVVHVFYREGSTEKSMDFWADMSAEYAFFCKHHCPGLCCILKSSFELFRNAKSRGGVAVIHDSLEECSYEKPDFFREGPVQAFCQKMPADPSFGVVLTVEKDGFSSGFYRGEESAAKLAGKVLPSGEKILAETKAWWKKYWERVPAVATGDEELDGIYYSGSYKYGIMTNPAGAVPGLQGPWIEDNHLPPWEGDYHFNINAQMCLSPGYKAGLFDHVKPMLDMVLSWKKVLRHNAECFAEIRDGYMLPHAVDDRCMCMGGFWTGSMDHGCAAWVSMLMFDYCDYTGDRDYLRNEVFDFMKGVMRVFQEMMEYKEDGTLTLPVSVSPEYRGSRIDAWGANSSFQLGAIHRLARNLIKSAEILGETLDPFWQEVIEKLPLCSLYGEAEKQEIALWDGTPLEESHRHHSHLGGICPFDVIDPQEEQWGRIIKNTQYRWVLKGMGDWVGWCMVWASQLRTRMGHAETAIRYLKLWKLFCNNPGGGSMHDPVCDGLSEYCNRGQIMQMDGAMGAVTAIQDLMAYSCNEVLYFFGGVSPRAKEASFRGMALPSSLRADGFFRNGKTEKIVLTASRPVTVRVRAAGVKGEFTRSMAEGECWTLDFTKEIAV